MQRCFIFCEVKTDEAIFWFAEETGAGHTRHADFADKPFGGVHVARDLHNVTVTSVWPYLLLALAGLFFRPRYWPWMVFYFVLRSALLMTIEAPEARYTLECFPMLFALALFFNFLIGGVTGVFLSDVPVDVTVHGGFFVLSHFHYTIMGGLLFAFMAGLYYWMPKMTGKMLNKRIGKWHFWTMFIFFNLTFFPMFIIGLLGQPRRVFEYAHNLQGLNDFSSISAFLLGGSFLIFVWNLLWSLWISPEKAPPNPWESLGLEWQTATPIPLHNFERIPVILTDPYHYSEEGAPDVADFGDQQLVGSSSAAAGDITNSN